jgi:hypothetical protein
VKTGVKATPPQEALSDRWRRIGKNNAGIAEADAEGLMAELEELRSEVS